MMKNLLSVFTILLLSTFLVSAQSLVVSDIETSIQGVAADELLATTAVVTNNGLDSRQVAVRFHEINLVSGANHYFCWAVCYSEGSVQDGFVTPIPGHTLTIEPDSAVGSFYADYKPHGTVGTSVFEYCFFDIVDTTDVTCVEVSFTTTLTGIEDAVQLIRLSSYPNPANEELTIGYDLNADIREPRIEMYNVLGTMVRSIKLNDNNGKVIIDTGDLPAGMYFYKLSTDNVDLALRKFMVSH